jgi:hypothetical protein
MVIEVGKTYKTYGDWDAIPVWKNYAKEDEEGSFIVVHKPGTEEEQFTLCNEEGEAQSIFTANEPPTYDVHHPADLILE